MEEASDSEQQTDSSTNDVASAPESGRELGGRPADGRLISGTAGWFAQRFGLSVTLSRWAFALAAVFGFSLAILVLIFDSKVFDGPLEDPTRFTFCGVGLLLGLAYPLLSTFLPSKSRSHWDFGSAFGAILLLTVLGAVVGHLISPYWTSAKFAITARGFSGFFTWFGDHSERVGFGAQDFVLVAFLFSATGFLWLQRESVRRFFRSMHVGVTLVTLSLLAVGLGVMVPQIDGFEDPEMRVDMAREYRDYQAFQEFGYQKLPRELQDGHEQYQAFRWAEGYFVYHLMHLYGFGMPEPHVTEQMEAGFERFGQKYGTEERDNRRKQMLAMRGGQDKVREIGEFIQRNEPTFWRFFQVSTALELNRLYKSNWFAFLLGYLFVAITFNTFKGKPKQWISIQKLGFFTVHIGMLVLLFGGLVSKLFTDRGIMHLFRGDGPQDTYWGFFDPNKKRQLPFAVSLEHFARVDWPSLEVYFMDDEARKLTSRVPTYTLWPGRKIELDLVEEADGSMRPRVAFEIRELSDKVEMGTSQFREMPAGTPGGFKMARFGIEVGQQTFEYNLPTVDTGFGRPITDAEQSFRLVTAAGDDPLQWFPEVPDMLGHLDILTSSTVDGQAKRFPATLGTSFEIEGGYRVNVVSGTADLDLERDRRESQHPLPLAKQPLRRPAVWLDLYAPDGRVERRAVIQGLRASDQVLADGSRLQDGFDLPEVEIDFTWDTWESPGAPRYLLHWDDQKRVELIAQSGERTPVKLREPLELPGEMVVVPESVFNAAFPEYDVKLLPPSENTGGWDADFYHQGPRGLTMDVVMNPGTTDEVRHEVTMSTSEEHGSFLWSAPDDSLRCRFFMNDRMLPFEWRSVLKIHERGADGTWQELDLGSEIAREIRVNDYFTHGGYRFFQTNANPEDPTYSGIGVVYDPGIEWVLVGMYTIILGTAITFLVRPVVLARRERRKKSILGTEAH